jgi:hypothetical protein
LVENREKECYEKLSSGDVCDYFDVELRAIRRDFNGKLTSVRLR